MNMKNTASFFLSCVLASCAEPQDLQKFGDQQKPPLEKQ
jgi:hypothetical protein